jgi:hypothetical protein
MDTSPKSPNPKDSIASTKLDLTLWPETATMLGALGLLDGALKYGRLNWRATEVRASVYIAAARRHLAAWFEGEWTDPDSGIPHMGHALACMAILVDAEANGTLIDDRQYVRGEVSGYRRLLTEMTPHVTRLQALHADKSPHHFTIADSASEAASIDVLPLGGTIDASLIGTAVGYGIPDAIPHQPV